ncbi:hypothetical protein KC363_g8900 [Hortaea werneckii]|nr:hypothetical protein KC325_g9102 [Hortaea werneckii]KAI6986248.1 hypothetical protein KC359_g8835 [Hortaea werneckii]KAI7139853.1 hypothetical protein KC344_g9104 [Hortaea werneckii]KAI7166621.1 hypothetical protein KC360_g9089 [Hortaea werneckii]KAI7182135.1 hypothetical protein KC363_g8900 [Hortaea werneckii]
MSNTNKRPKKLQRISQACDLCHRRSIRCRPSTENPEQCQNCYDFAVDCTYSRPFKRRRQQSTPQNATSPLPLRDLSTGTTQTISPPTDDSRPSAPAGVADLSARSSVSSQAAKAPSKDYTGAYDNIREGQDEDSLEVAWRSFAFASLSTIDEYLTIYMDVVYPINPLFHGPTLWERVRNRQHLTHRDFFASVMAACALAAARARDGATGDTRRVADRPERTSEIFFAAAADAVSKDLSKARGLGYMRACGLLAITAIQYGQINTMHQYMGMYHTLAALQQFHDERKWPSDITVVELEERRRTFWTMYSLDIYCSVVFDSVMKSQENHSNVRYPSEINDEDLLSGTFPTTNEDNWLRGFNFTTDLYRILEHSIKRVRRTKPVRDDRISITRLLIADNIPEAQVMDSVVSLFYQLPPALKDYSLRQGNDKYQSYMGFQAANIQATLQLVRMTLFSTSPTHDVNHKCDVAQHALSVFHNIAPEYLRAISTPLVYHLGGIGSILASVMEGLLCEISYQRVRRLLVSMADLLDGLESGLQPTAGASRNIRKQIDRIDRYMEDQQRLMRSVQPGQPPMQAQTLTSPYRGYPVHSPEGMVNGALPSSDQQAQIMDGMNMEAQYDEFQLPQDLVHDGAWPWPFGFAAPDQQMTMEMGFQSQTLITNNPTAHSVLPTLPEDPAQPPQEPLIDWSPVPSHVHTLFLKHLVLSARYLRHADRDLLLDWVLAELGFPDLVNLDRLSDDFQDFCVQGRRRGRRGVGGVGASESWSGREDAGDDERDVEKAGREEKQGREKEGWFESARPERKGKAGEFLVKAAGILSVVSVSKGNSLLELARGLQGGGRGFGGAARGSALL